MQTPDAEDDGATTGGGSERCNGWKQPVTLFVILFLRLPPLAKFGKFYQHLFCLGIAPLQYRIALQRPKSARYHSELSNSSSGKVLWLFQMKNYDNQWGLKTPLIVFWGNIERATHNNIPQYIFHPLNISAKVDFSEVMKVLVKGNGYHILFFSST